MAGRAPGPAGHFATFASIFDGFYIIGSFLLRRKQQKQTILHAQLRPEDGVGKKSFKSGHFFCQHRLSAWGAARAPDLWNLKFCFNARLQDVAPIFLHLEQKEFSNSLLSDETWKVNHGWVTEFDRKTSRGELPRKICHSDFLWAG